MAVVICLLRGVNVGGHHKIRMEALRALCESLGLEAPETYVQSGNVVFNTKERNLTRLARRMEEAIERTFGFPAPVVLRSAAELRSVVARNPFAAREGIEPAKLIVTFLAADPPPEARAKLLQIQANPEELRLDGRELYIYFPNGAGQSKLPVASLERAMRAKGTARNWNTILRLLDLAEERGTAR
jgi:uncharacterized protein (DUF1697 family)